MIAPSPPVHPVTAEPEELPLELREIPPLLEADDPFTRDDDGRDADRVQYLRGLWHNQDNALRDRDRTIEQHLRMLAGKHWDVWNETLGQWIDVTRYMDDAERRWRFLPVLNHTLHWYMLLHARCTENPPVVTWQPSSGDRLDAELAEVMDVIWKHLWNDVGMIEAVDQLFSWLIPGGEAYLMSRIDPMGGPLRSWEGPAELPVIGPGGEAVPGMTRRAPVVPFGPDGEPLARMLFDGTLEQTDEAHQEHEGALAVDVLSIFEARGEWGPTPWHQKAWQTRRSLLTPEQVWNEWGVEVEPSITGQEAEDTAEFQRVLLGSGYYGTSQGDPFLGSVHGEDLASYVEVLEGWFRPARHSGMQKRPGDPGGRLLIVAGDKRIRDGTRPVDFKYGGPIRQFLFVNVPGRPSGTSPEEMLVGPQKSLNRTAAQIHQLTTLLSNPDRVIDLASGIQPGQVKNRPGQTIEAFLEGYQGEPIRFTNPPNLPTDVWRLLEHLRTEFNDLGNVTGSEGRAPTSDASGELVKELRFNADRFVGPTLRRAVIEMGRMAEDWKALIPLMWDEEKVLQVAGEDSIARTVVVYPHLFEQGQVDVVPEIESMLPEGRGERQARVLMHWEKGLYGDPKSPEALERYWQNARFPHMSREARPGGMDRVTAEHAVNKLIQGVPSEQIPILEVYEMPVFLGVVERVMKSPQFLDLSPDIQQEFWEFRTDLLLAALQKEQRRAAYQTALQTGALAAGAEATHPAVADELGEATTPDPADGNAVAPGPPDRGPTATPMPA